VVCATTTSGGTRGESDGQTSQTQIEIQTAHNKAHRATYSPSRRERYIYLKKSSHHLVGMRWTPAVVRVEGVDAGEDRSTWSTE